MKLNKPVSLLLQVLLVAAGLATVFLTALSSNVFVSSQEYSWATVFSVENMKVVGFQLGVVGAIVLAIRFLWKH